MRILLRVAVSAGVLAALLLILPWSELQGALARLSPFVWAAVLAGFLAGHAAGVVKWRLVVNAGRSGLRLRDAIRAYALGLFANLCLPSLVGGDVLRAAVAARATGRAEAVVLAGVADRVLDVSALLVLAIGGALATGSRLPGGPVTAAALAGAAAVGVAALAAALRRPVSAWPRRVRRPVARALVALRRMRRRPVTALAAFTLALLLQSGFVLLNAWIGRSIGIAVPLAVWFFAWPLAKLTGLLPISLGGLGVRDAALGGLLVPVGVPLALGVVASLIWETVLIAGGLLAGGLWLALKAPAGVPGPVRTRAAVRTGA